MYHGHEARWCCATFHCIVVHMLYLSASYLVLYVWFMEASTALSSVCKRCGIVCSSVSSEVLQLEQCGVVHKDGQSISQSVSPNRTDPYHRSSLCYLSLPHSTGSRRRVVRLRIDVTNGVKDEILLVTLIPSSSFFLPFFFLDFYHFLDAKIRLR